MPLSSGAKSDCRDSKGRFLPGHTLAGPGRKSPHSEAVKAVQRAALEHGLPCLVQACQAGDIEAAKALCGLGLPRLKPVSLMDFVPLSEGADIATKAAEVFAALAAGGLTTDTADALTAALKVLADAAEVGELKRKLEALEEQTQGGRCGVLVVPGVASPEDWTREAAKGAASEPQE